MIPLPLWCPMDFQETLVARICASLTQQGIAVVPSDIELGAATEVVVDQAPSIEISVSVPRRNIAPFTVTYPLTNLVWLQEQWLKTDTIIDRADAYDTASLVRTINQRLPADAALDPTLVQVETMFSPTDGEVCYRLSPVAGVVTPAYYGSIELYAVSPRLNPLALYAQVAGVTALPQSNAEFLALAQHGAMAYVGDATGLPAGRLGEWSSWRLREHAMLYPNMAAVIPVNDTPTRVATIAPTNPGDTANGRELIVVCDRALDLTLEFYLDDVVQRTVTVTTIPHQPVPVSVHGVTAAAILAIYAASPEPARLKFGMSYTFGSIMASNHPEYHPTVVIESALPPCVRFNDLENVVADDYLIVAPGFSLGAQLAVMSAGADVALQSLLLDGEPVLTIRRAGLNLKVELTLGSQSIELTQPIPYFNSPFTYQLGWDGSALYFQVNGVVTSTPYAPSSVRHDGLYYQIGGMGGGSFDLYRHYASRTFNDEVKHLWRQEYWQ